MTRSLIAGSALALALVLAAVALPPGPAEVMGQGKGKGKGGGAAAPRPTPAISRPAPRPAAPRPAARPVPRPAPAAPRPAERPVQRPSIGPAQPVARPTPRPAAPTIVNRPNTTVNRPNTTVNRPNTTINRPNTTVNRPTVNSNNTINRVGDRVTNRTNVNRTTVNNTTINRTTVVNRAGGYSRAGYNGRAWWGGTSTYWNRPWYGNRPAWYWGQPYYGYHAGWHHGFWNFWSSPPALWFGAGLAAGWLSSPGDNYAYVNPYYVAPAVVVEQLNYAQPLPAPPTELQSAAYAPDPDLDGDGVPDVRATTDLPPPADNPTAATANRRLDDAREAFKAGQYAQAQALTEAAIKELPSDPTLHEFRALALFAQQKYKESAAALYAVLSAGPGWDWPTMRALYPDAATYTAQLRALEAAVKGDPQSGAGHFLLGYHYLVIGDKAAAESQLREVTRVQPSDKLAAALLKSLSATSADAPPAPGR